MRIGSCRVARVVAWIFLAGCGVWACGQSSVDGAIGGRVVDRSGRPVPSVQVRVESAATHGLRVVSTGVDGSFLAAHGVAGLRVSFIVSAALMLAVVAVAVLGLRDAPNGERSNA